MADEESTRAPLKVTFEQSGGFAGLVKGCVLDADALPADESAELRRLVAASGLETSSKVTSRGARDRRQLAELQCRHALTQCLCQCCHVVSPLRHYKTGLLICVLTPV